MRKLTIDTKNFNRQIWTFKKLFSVQKTYFFSSSASILWKLFSPASIPSPDHVESRVREPGHVPVSPLTECQWCRRPGAGD